MFGGEERKACPGCFGIAGDARRLPYAAETPGSTP